MKVIMLDLGDRYSEMILKSKRESEGEREQ